MLTWYSDVIKKVREILSNERGGNHPIHCALNWLLKRETQKWFYNNSLSLRLFYTKTQGFSLIQLKNIGIIKFHCFVKFLMKVHGI